MLKNYCFSKKLLQQRALASSVAEFHLSSVMLREEDEAKEERKDRVETLPNETVQL